MLTIPNARGMLSRGRDRAFDLWWRAAPAIIPVATGSYPHIRLPQRIKDGGLTKATDRVGTLDDGLSLLPWCSPHVLLFGKLPVCGKVASPAVARQLPLAVIGWVVM